MKPSTDLSWHPRIQRWYWRVRGRIRSTWRALHPKPTQDELELREWERIERDKDRSCQQEARKYIKLITPAMTQIGNEIQGIYSSKVVKWDLIARDIEFTKIFLKLRIDPRYIPPSLMVSQLRKDPRWIKGIEQAIGLPVVWEVGEIGVILTIYRPEEEHLVRRVITVEDLISDDDSI